MGARRLAIAAVAVRPARRRRHAPVPQLAVADRPLEDPGQPATHTVRARRLPRAGGRLDVAAARRPPLDGLRPGDDRVADAAAGGCGDRAATDRHHRAQPPACARQGPLAGRAANGLPGHLPPPPGLADGGRDQPDPVPAVCQSPQPSRVGHRGPGVSQRELGRRGLLSQHGGGVVATVSCRARRAIRWKRRSVDRGAVRAPVARLPRHRVLDQPGPACREGVSGLRCGRGRASSRCTPHLAVLRDVRHGREQPAAAGQLPGGPQARSWRAAPRRPMSACTCSPPSAPADFGWIGTIEAVERLEATLADLDRLQRFRGHFYNWYDTGTFGRWSRATCPRSTAATSPRT